MYSLKLVYEDDIRKISLDTLAVDSLYARAKILFPDLENVPFEQLFLHYFDDEGDKIRIMCDVDLMEALRTVQTQSNVTLKIFIQTQLSAPLTSSTTFGTSPSRFGSGSNLSSSAIITPPMMSMFNNFTSSVMQNPVAMQQMSAMVPAMMPFLPQLLSSMFLNPNASMQQPAPTFSTTTDDIMSSSVSTSTIIDARDASTETPVSEVSSQTTQTQVHPSATQTTQTQSNPSQTTQTFQNSSTTQTTQTSQTPSITQTTQTQQIPISVQTTQTQVSCSSETQTVQAQQASIETQATLTGNPPDSPSFYDSLNGTKFGRLLDQLTELGFTDKEKCIRVLVKHGGNLPEAVDELLLEC